MMNRTIASSPFDVITAHTAVFEAQLLHLSEEVEALRVVVRSLEAEAPEAVSDGFWTALDREADDLRSRRSPAVLDDPGGPESPLSTAVAWNLEVQTEVKVFSIQSVRLKAHERFLRERQAEARRDAWRAERVEKMDGGEGDRA